MGTATMRRSAPTSGWRFPFAFTPIPRLCGDLGGIEGLFRSGRLSQAGTLLYAIISERTFGRAREQGTAPPEWWEVSRDELADTIQATERHANRLLIEAQTCFMPRTTTAAERVAAIEAAEDGDAPLGVIEVRPGRAGRIRLRLAGGATDAGKVLQSSVPTDPGQWYHHRVKHPNATKTAQEAKRRCVPAQRIELKCPAGVAACPVKEVWENPSTGTLVNIALPDVDVIPADPSPPSTSPPEPVCAQTRDANKRTSPHVGTYMSQPPITPTGEDKANIATAIASIVGDELGWSLELSIAREAVAKLGRATLDEFRSQLQSEIRQAKPKSHPYIVHVAEHAAKAHTAMEARTRLGPDPSPPAARKSYAEQLKEEYVRSRTKT